MIFRILTTITFNLIWFGAVCQIDTTISASSKPYMASYPSNKIGTLAIDLGILGSNLSYDWRFAHLFSLRADLGAGARILSWGNIWHLTDTENYYVAIHPNFSLATRYYYNQRQEITSDYKKSSKFLAFKINCIPPWFIQTIRSKRGWPRPTIPGILELVPQWGIRTSKGRVYFELNLGYSFPLKDIFTDNEYEDSRINIFCRVGYRF
ncbi:MAG: hypothetical protein KDC53_19940 [Saprospiraceae bacterium]|nr:hypothetical protein [Saprospiraceae bacterium]